MKTTTKMDVIVWYNFLSIAPDALTVYYMPMLFI